MSDSATFSVRKSAFENERTWTVDATGLSWSAPDKSGHFDFKDIATIRVAWTGTRFDTGRHAAHVTRVNGWTETIVSSHYKGPAQFESRAGTYLPFVQALIALTARHNPACVFLAGARPLNYWASAGVMVAGLGLLLLVGFTIGVPLTGLIAAKLVIIAFLLPLAIRWLKRNRPRQFTPPVIPADVLPSG